MTSGKLTYCKAFTMKVFKQKVSKQQLLLTCGLEHKNRCLSLIFKLEKTRSEIRNKVNTNNRN